MRRVWKIGLAGASVLTAFVFANNTSGVSPGRERLPALLVHRGMAQRFDLTQSELDSCAVARMIRPHHEYLENTITSMQAAFDRGADVVEFDIQRTREERFAVFHDRRLDCRTERTGLTREFTLAELKTVDIGYGYTADGGITFPFRGKGVGLMPSLEEVFETFPTRSFLIDIKGTDPRDGELLAEHLRKMSPLQQSHLTVFVRDSTLRGFRSKLPDIPSFSAQSIQGCLVRYIAYGWTGAIPSACEKSVLFVPINVAPWLWGWPYRFMNRMESKGSMIVLMGPLGGYDFPAGLDTADQLAQIPADYDGGIWTNNVELAASAMKKGF